MGKDRRFELESATFIRCNKPCGWPWDESVTTVVENVRVTNSKTDLVPVCTAPGAPFQGKTISYPSDFTKRPVDEARVCLIKCSERGLQVEEAQ